MPRQKLDNRRVLGPYRNGREYRIVIFDPTGDPPRSDLTFASESAAAKAKAQIESEWDRLAEVTIADTLERYEEHQKRQGNKPGSYTETMRRLRLFLSAVDEQAVGTLTKKQAVELYDAFSDGRSVDYHRNTLIQARSFMRWCLEKGWRRDNPFDGVKGIGKRKRGKKQLTRDEARKFSAAAQAMADRGDHGALGAWMLLMMGLRQSEVWKRLVRDVDESATLLRIEEAKTDAGNRLVEIPDVLRPYLARVIDGRIAEEWLFGPHTKSWLRAAVRRVCAKANVPQVSPHGLRGTHASLSAMAGATAHLVAQQLGHESTSTTLAHYTDAGAAQTAKQRTAMQVINGGKR